VLVAWAVAVLVLAVAVVVEAGGYAARGEGVAPGDVEVARQVVGMAAAVDAGDVVGVRE
jgi:hypothetical protein